MTSLNDALMIELAYCRHTDKSVSETATRIEALVTRKHVLWGPNEPDCPREIKASNGELTRLLCKVCGQYDMRTAYCLGGEQP